MPALMTCPVCGFHGNHGFVEAGLSANDEFIWKFYHYSTRGVCCSYYIGEKWFATMREAFLHKAPRVLCTWARARLAQIEGHPRRAARLFKQWNEEEESGRYSGYRV